MSVSHPSMISIGSPMRPASQCRQRSDSRIDLENCRSDSAKRQLDALSEERMQDFLERRLRFTGLALSATVSSLLLIKSLAGSGTIWLVLASVLVTCVSGLTAQLFYSRQLKPESTLRHTELAVFCCSFVTFAMLAFSDLEASSQTANLQKYLLTIRETVFLSVALLLLYGLFIPGRCRRTAGIAGALATIPAVTIVLSLLIHAPAFEAVPGTVWIRLACENLILLAAATGGATLSTEVSRRIRQRSIHVEELGPYILQTPLGSGGMGDVYLAEHRLLKRLCAVKLIHPDKAGDAGMRARFEREVRATAMLTHLNTVEVYDYGTTRGGRFFYAMEYLEGLNLDQIVQRCGPMPAERVIFILKQICGALHEAASEGLVHRDIKPSNIFLAERGRMYDVAKLLDFGLVQPALRESVGLRRTSTQIQGSPTFMCPEQASGLEPDCRGDLYSLGAVAWFLLTGHPPFRDKNPVMLIVAHATSPVPGFAECGAIVPDDLANVVMKCLAKKPEDRFRSPRDLLIALEACTTSSDWGWQRAEQWWQQHCPLDCQNLDVADERSPDPPRDESESELELTGGADKTLIFNRSALTAPGAGFR